MKIAIDATNIKAGGGLTHLKRIIDNQNRNHQLQVIGGEWLSEINDSSILEKKQFNKYFNSLVKQEIFKSQKLPGILAEAEIAFIPGGTFSSKEIPYVTMSQNMLVFEDKERNRFPKSFTWLRYHLLEYLQVRSFKHAKGIIYISHYAKKYIENKYPILRNKKSKVIYHGISDEFRQSPKEQFQITKYSLKNPFKLSYISIINYYKHQWNVIDAVKKLREEGYPIELELIGPLYKPAENKLKTALSGAEDFVKYRGKVPYNEISESYKRADLFVFASTCENMPNILVEAMSAGLPILSSNYGPMPEILKDGGVYMDPTNIESIYSGLKKLLLEPELRTEVANKAFNYSMEFSWEKTSNGTFDFIKNIALELKK